MLKDLLPFPDVNTECSVVKADIGEPVEVSEEYSAVEADIGETFEVSKEHSAVEANVGETVEVSKEHSAVVANIGKSVEVSKEHSDVEANIGETVEVSKLNIDCRESGNAANNDQMTTKKAVNQSPVDDQVTVNPICEVICEANDTQTVNGEVLEENQKV